MTLRCTTAMRSFPSPRGAHWPLSDCPCRGVGREGEGEGEGEINR